MIYLNKIHTNISSVNLWHSVGKKHFYDQISIVKTIYQPTDHQLDSRLTILSQ